MSIDTLIQELKSKLDNFEATQGAEEVGTVLEVSDGIARVSGISRCMSSEILEFDSGGSEGKTFGIALNLEEDSVGVIILGEYSHIKEGSLVKRTGQVLSVPVSDRMIGRVLNPLLAPVDGKGAIDSSQTYRVERIAPGVMKREPVNEPLETGILAIDSMIPIGKGQRELIIGDRQTGKTTVAIDTILNQKGKDVLCIYVAIAQKRSKVARIVAELEKAGAMDYTTIVLSSASDGPAYSYIAPYAGTALAEYFMDQKKDVLIIYDDLSKHAVSYREISLLLRRPPGREAYPGDVFYLHSRLLERAVKRNAKSGGGSITALPVIETQGGDLSAYIPTNVISITDGQIFLEAGLFNKGVRPAINTGNSVSRVGGAAQRKGMKKVAGRLRTQMAQFRELEAFAQFASDLDEATRKQLDRGLRGRELLKQGSGKPIRAGAQVALIYALNEGHLDGVSLENIAEWKQKFIDHLLAVHRDLLDEIERDWNDGISGKLNDVIQAFSYTS